MDSFDRTSLLEMAGGAIMERVDFELSRVVDNILDPNTEAKVKRQIQLTVTLEPSDDRRMISVSAQAKTKLAPTTPVKTALCFASGKDGEAVLAEMTPQIPGQMDFSGAEQSQPKIMKLANSI